MDRNVADGKRINNQTKTRRINKMKKIIYAAGKNGGKTKWIIENIIKECLSGNTCYYMGGIKTYDKICELLGNEDPSKYLKDGQKIPEINFVCINKDTNPEGDKCAIFTDDVVWEIANIHPMAVRKFFNLNVKWYITINTQNAVNDIVKKEETNG